MGVGMRARSQGDNTYLFHPEHNNAKIKEIYILEYARVSAFGALSITHVRGTRNKQVLAEGNIYLYYHERQDSTCKDNRGLPTQFTTKDATVHEHDGQP